MGYKNNYSWNIHYRYKAELIVEASMHKEDQDNTIAPKRKYSENTIAKL